MEYVNERPASHLPIKVQELLWERCRAFFQAKPESGKLEPEHVQAVQTLDRLIRENNYKLLDTIGLSDVIKALKATPRWTLIKGSMPFIMLCCSAVLEQRNFLGLSDKLTPPVIKLFSLFHWLVLEAVEDCRPAAADMKLDLHTIELFVEVLVPCAQHIHDSDLTFSLQSGLQIWAPLWNHHGPTSSLLALPVVQVKHRPVSRLLGGSGVSKESFVATYFDIAVLKVMMLDNWSSYGYRWCLAYLERILRSLLRSHIADEESYLVLTVARRFWPQKSSMHSSSSSGEGAWQSSPKLMASNQLSLGYGTSKLSAMLRENIDETLPEYLRTYVTELGDLRISFVLRVLQKFCKQSASTPYASTLILIIAELIELGIGTNKIEDLSEQLEVILYCYVSIYRAIGCEHGCHNGVRGIIGESLRLILQTYFEKLVKQHPSRVQFWFKSYVLLEGLTKISDFLHAFLGPCDVLRRSSAASSPVCAVKIVEQQWEASEIRSSEHISNYETYIKIQLDNGSCLLKWVGPVIFQRLTKDMFKHADLMRSEYFDELAQLAQYTRSYHPLVLRTIIMSGILNSFDRKLSTVPEHLDVTKEKKPRPSEFGREDLTISRSTPLLKRLVLSMGYGKVPESDAAKLPKQESKISKGTKKNRFALLAKHMREQVSEDRDVAYAPAYSTLPHPASVGNTSMSSSTDQGEIASTLPRSWLTKFKNRNAQDVALASSTSRDGALIGDSSLKTGSSDLASGKLIKLAELHSGLHVLRGVLQVCSPGDVPEEDMIAAMFDLEAPVVSRAAYLLELAYFVHQCNNGHWPALLKFSQRLHRQNPRRDSTAVTSLVDIKYAAGMVFHKWGVVISRKLEEILSQMKAKCEKQGVSKHKKQRHVPFMYQGDVSVVSSQCPVSLCFMACQLLCEITAFLRESHSVTASLHVSQVMQSLGLRSRSLTATSKTSGGATPQPSPRNIPLPKLSHAGVSRKVAAVNRRKSSATYGVLGHSNSSEREEPKSATIQRRKSYLSESVQRSPKTKSIYVRRVSRPSLEHQRSAVSSFEDEIVQDQGFDYPWISAIILMHKMMNVKCVHGDDCCELCPVEQLKDCDMLQKALTCVYESRHDSQPDWLVELLGDDLADQADKKDVMLRYLNENVGSLLHAPFSALCKAVIIMDNAQLADCLSTSWEVLLYPDEKLASAASTLFLIASTRLDVSVSNFLAGQLSAEDASARAKAVHRFWVLWNHRETCLNNVEEDAKLSLWVPMPKLEYTLPSQEIGGMLTGNRVSFYIPDCPWMPGTPFPDEAELSDDEEEFYFLDDEKQKRVNEQKRIKKLKTLRDNCVLRSVLIGAHAIDQDDQHEDEANVAVSAPAFFPPALCTGFLHLIELLGDASLTCYKQSVSSLVLQLIWKCLVDDPTIFFRKFFEKMTKANRLEELVLLLRKLLLHIPVLPLEAGHRLFNNLIGIVMFYDRANRAGSNERVASVMSLLWQIVPSIPNLAFADMKQSLRREHADHTLLITANANGTKELAVTYLNNKEKFNVLEDMTFNQLLTQCKGLFSLSGDEIWLVDKHSGQILENTLKIRDVYIFRKGFPAPTLKVEEIDPATSFSKRQIQAFTGKMSDIFKLSLSQLVLNALPDKRQVYFVYTELYKQGSFPKRAIELDFNLCGGPEIGKELFAIDVILKNKWVKFISEVLFNLTESSPWCKDVLDVFLCVINGALLLHSEDVFTLRQCLASLINICKRFGKIFSIDGYHEIMPTLLRVYAHHEDNQLTRSAIEFAVSQMFILHQNPFILQMLASVAPVLLTDYVTNLPKEQRTDMVPARSLFSLIESLEHQPKDTLEIISLVHETTVKPYDCCYVNRAEDENGKIDLCLRLCLTIIAFDPESTRSLQLLYVLSALVPYFLKHLETNAEVAEGTGDAKKREQRHLKLLVKYIGTIIEQSDYLTEHYRPEGSVMSDPRAQASSSSSSFLWSGIRHIGNSLRRWFGWTKELTLEGEELERNLISGENESPIQIDETNVEEKSNLDIYYQPRTILLVLSADFMLKCTERLKKKRDDGRSKSSIIIQDEHARILADVAIALLRLVLFDHKVLANLGLQRFMLDALPCIDWSGEQAEIFGVIVYRLTRIFSRIVQKSEYLKFVHWDNLEVLIRGVYLAIRRQISLADLHQVKELLMACTRIVSGEVELPMLETTTFAGRISPSSFSFNNAVIKLASHLLFVKPDIYDLQQTVGTFLQNYDVTKVERFLIHWLLPLCIRMGTGRYDYPRMPKKDVSYVLSVLVSILMPKSRENHHLVGPMATLTLLGLQIGRSRDVASPSLCQVAFLGFKIMLTIYSGELGRNWTSVKRTFEEYIKTNDRDVAAWNFIAFVVSNRLPLLVYILPVVKRMIADPAAYHSSIQNVFSRIRRDLELPPSQSGRSWLIQRLLNELSSLQSAVGDEVLDVIGGEPPLVLEKPKPRARNQHISADDIKAMSRVSRIETGAGDDGNGSGHGTESELGDIPERLSLERDNRETDSYGSDPAGSEDSVSLDDKMVSSSTKKAFRREISTSKRVSFSDPQEECSPCSVISTRLGDMTACLEADAEGSAPDELDGESHQFSVSGSDYVLPRPRREVFKKRHFNVDRAVANDSVSPGTPQDGVLGFEGIDRSDASISSDEPEHADGGDPVADARPHLHRQHRVGSRKSGGCSGFPSPVGDDVDSTPRLTGGAAHELLPDADGLIAAKFAKDSSTFGDHDVQSATTEVEERDTCTYLFVPRPASRLMSGQFGSASALFYSETPSAVPGHDAAVASASDNPAFDNETDACALREDPDASPTRQHPRSR